MTFKELQSLRAVDVYRLQRPPVIICLSGGRTNFQKWEDSAAYSEGLQRHSQEAHLRAYTWMCNQFTARMGRSPKAALSWSWFAMETDVLKMRKNDDEVLLHLRVPVRVLLVSDHRGWQDVLWTAPIFEPHEPVQPAVMTGGSKEASWESIFDIPAATLTCKLQTVTDRIEPEWLLHT